MRYFELRQGEHLRNPIKIQWAKQDVYQYNPTREQFDNFPNIHVGYYDYTDTIEIPEVLEGSTFFVGEEVKHVLKMYDESIPFKGVQVYPFGMLSKIVPTYWTFFPMEADCLHESVEILPNGEMKEMLLDTNKISGVPVFKVAGIRVHRIIVTLPVAESLLRRQLFGISLKEVKVI